MKLSALLRPELTCAQAPGLSKKRVLEFVADLIAEHTNELIADPLYQALLARERLGSTGIGGGIAVPHCRVAECERPVAAFLKLDSPVDFDAIDNEPVDMVFALVVPEGQESEHLTILARIASICQDQAAVRRLRTLTSADELWHQLIDLDEANS